MGKVMTADQHYPQAVLTWLETHQSSLLAQRSRQLWQAINEELSLLVGDRGFSTLYSRCLDICGTSFPWMEKAPVRSPPALCFDTLAAQLATHAQSDALAASRALFSTFYELLVRLIGEALAVGVLDAAWRDRLHRRPLLFALKSVPSAQQ
jgi:hypothetical protein